MRAWVRRALVQVCVKGEGAQERVTGRGSEQWKE